jgi:hypothetical protein
LGGLLFGPITTEADRGVDVAGVAIVKEVKKSVITISIRTSTVIIFGVGGESSCLLNEARDVILPVEVFRSLGGR